MADHHKAEIRTQGGDVGTGGSQGEFMTDDALVAKQARKIESLELTISHIRRELKESYGHAVCIGGPLNDNKLQFTNDQLLTVSRIHAGVSNSLDYIQDLYEND